MIACVNLIKGLSNIQGSGITYVIENVPNSAQFPEITDALGPAIIIEAHKLGNKRGTTTIDGLLTSLRHKLLGACLDHNISKWLLKASQVYAQSENAHHSSLPPNTDPSCYPDNWIVDTGDTPHFTGHQSNFSNCREISPRLVHGMNLYAIGSGTVKVAVPTKTTSAPHPGECTMTLHNVLYVPDLIKNGAKVTRLLSQLAAHTLENGTKPIFVSSADSSVIHFGEYFIELDLHIHRNLLTMRSMIIHGNQPA